MLQQDGQLFQCVGPPYDTQIVSDDGCSLVGMLYVIKGDFDWLVNTSTAWPGINR